MTEQTQPRSMPSEKLPAVERRAAQRFPLIQECLVRPSDATLAGIEDWHGIAYNISTLGIGIALPFPIRLGVTLIIEPWGIFKAKPVRARVVRSCIREFLWFHGCEFEEPLTPAELRVWRR